MMITIITGNINSGKTSRMISTFKHAKAGIGDGFVSIKTFYDGACIGYELTRISTGERKPLAILKNHYRGQFPRFFEYGPFIFSLNGFKFGEEILLESLSNDMIKDVYIDEIGPIELGKRGFYPVMKKVLDSEKTLFFCVRSSCLPAVIEEFNLAAYPTLVLHI